MKLRDSSRHKTRKCVNVFDYYVTQNNPAGSCHLKIIQGLAREIDFRVFAVEFDNPYPDDVEYVRIPAIRRPLVALYLSFHLSTQVMRLRHREIAVRQSIESNLWPTDVCYAHFCHTAYLRSRLVLKDRSSVRQILRYLNHKAHALLEGPVLRRAKLVVVPSHGLARELTAHFPDIAHKIRIVPNPVDIERMRRPAGFDRNKVRSSLGLSDDDVLFAFVALGHFERKGLDLLVEALRAAEDRTKLLIVGGQPNLVNEWVQRTKRAGLANRVVFVGNQADVRPYLWSADVFALPSEYEVFPLSVLEAAAAGLPLLVSSVNGVEEFIEGATMGQVVQRSPEHIAAAMNHLASMSIERRRELGHAACNAVRRYSVAAFLDNWREIYAELAY